MTEKISFDELEKELKAHDFSLVTFNDNEIKIKGISGVTRFMIIIMSFIGLCLVAFGYVSIFVIEKPEYVAGALLTAAGIVLILLPLYNYYSKSYYEFKFNKLDKSVIIKNLNPLPSTLVIPFDDIESIHLKKNTLNSYVDNRSTGSFIYNYSISLKLNNKENKGIIRFSKRDERIEMFSINFTDILVDLTGKQREFEVAKQQ
jgi:hypothetical protein